MTTTREAASHEPGRGGIMGNAHEKRRWVWRASQVVVAAGVVVLAACDFKVTNPGPVQDKNLSDPGAFDAIANGIGQALSNAMNYTVLQGAIITRELFPTGQTGQFGIEPQNEFGSLTPDEQGDPWSNGQQARWMAENGIARMTGVLSAADQAKSKPLAHAYLWEGYTNRLLGENMCVSIVDGGAPTPSTDYLKLAETAFTNAMQTATSAGDATTAMAAQAGRASVRMDLGDWAGAVSDASAVPEDFVFQMPYYDVGDEYGYNRTAWSSMSNPYRAHTQWNTWYAAYEDTTGDPRTAYEKTDEFGSGALQGVGAVLWWPQQKFTSKISPINLSTGREMKLIVAESDLRDGDWQGAMTIINELRTSKGVNAATATGLDDAWTLLKRERGIELWLEGRRLNDLRRWQADNTPGALSPLESVGTASYLQHQDLCFPPSRQEYNTNPNLQG
jgi:starch-binding outer membrane protein, SusD/RagB family